MDIKKIGSTCRYYRRFYEFSQTDIANIAGVHYHTIIAFERGECYNMLVFLAYIEAMPDKQTKIDLLKSALL